jgi:hypothetical protein
LQDPPKFTQIGIFGLKTNHLATLLGSTSSYVHIDYAKQTIVGSNLAHLVTAELGSAGPPRHPEVSAAGLVVGGRGAAAAAASGLEGGAGGGGHGLAGSVEEVAAAEPELELNL